MAFFKRASNEPSSKPSTGARMGVGRNLHSAQTLEAGLATLESVLDEHAPTRYAAMPTLIPVNAQWSGSDEAPAGFRYASYGQDSVLIFAFWREESGTTIGLYPLGGEADLQTPLVGQWKRRDGSLSSRGQFPGGTVTLGAPQLPANYFEDLLAGGGAEVNEQNLDRARKQVTTMFLIKAGQFLGSSHGQRAADQFVDQHLWDGSPATPQRVLDDLGAMTSGLLPYIADLPWRIRGLLLEPDEAGKVRGVLWEDCGVA